MSKNIIKGAGCCFFIEEEGEYYVLLGRDHQTQKWNDFGGSCESWESPWATAIRECKEETSCTIDPSNMEYEFKIFLRSYCCYFFRVDNLISDFDEIKKHFDINHSRFRAYFSSESYRSNRKRELDKLEDQKSTQNPGLKYRPIFTFDDKIYTFDTYDNNECYIENDEIGLFRVDDLLFSQYKHALNPRFRKILEKFRSSDVCSGFFPKLPINDIIPRQSFTPEQIFKVKVLS